MERGSNSAVVLEERARRVKASLERGNKAGAQALEAYREAGRELCEIKKIIPHGAFGHFVEAQCGCTRQWAARLMQLAREWNNYTAAQDWATKIDRTLRSNDFTVDGALGLIREWRRAGNGDPGPSPNRSPRSAARAANGEIDAVRHAADVYARLFEEKLVKIQPAVPASTLAAEEVEKAEKIAARWLRGATDGERLAAITALYKFASNRGRTLRQLIRECQIDCQGNFPFPAPQSGRSSH